MEMSKCAKKYIHLYRRKEIYILSLRIEILLFWDYTLTVEIVCILAYKTNEVWNYKKELELYNKSAMRNENN